MIIWTRWGIFVVLFVGLGVLIGFLLQQVSGVRAESGPLVGVFIGLGLMLSSALLWLTARRLLGRVIDKPYLAAVTVPVDPPEVDENGRQIFSRQVPVRHPETGEPIVVRPSSTLFFIPVRYWPFVLGGIGLVVLLANLVTVRVA